jgi:hypothetical protein
VSNNFLKNNQQTQGGAKHEKDLNTGSEKTAMTESESALQNHRCTKGQ